MQRRQNVIQKQAPTPQSLHSRFVNECSAALPSNNLQFVLGYLVNAHMPHLFGDISSNLWNRLEATKLLSRSQGSSSVPRL